MMTSARRFTLFTSVCICVWIILYGVFLQPREHLYFASKNLLNLQEWIRPKFYQTDGPGTQKQGSIYWVTGELEANLTDRVLEFQRELAKIRKHFLRGIALRNDSESFKLPGVKRRVWAADKDTLYQLQNETDIVSVALAWIDSKIAMRDPRNLLLRDYYRWAEDGELCLWKKGMPTSFTMPSQAASCSANEMVLSNPEQLHPYFVNPKNIPREELISVSSSGPFVRHRPTNGTHALPHIFYVHLVGHGTVDAFGNVLTRDVKIFPISCGRKQMAAASDMVNETSIPLYAEVFVASQFWGASVYHNLLECLPRLAPYVDFLQTHSGINIHIQQMKNRTASALEILGIHRSRLVSGVVQARVVYLPQGTACGKPGLHSSQLLSQMYRNVLKLKYPPKSLLRNSIVVIKRTGNRSFRQASTIEKLVEKLARKSGHRYELFADDPVPSLEETMMIFNRASIVVAPHGAGLSNLLFSEPGTLVIEGVCNPPHVNLCYQTTAYVLGHKHHGLLSEFGCEDFIEISPWRISHVLKFYLKLRM